MELTLDSVQFSYDRGLPTQKTVLDSVSLRVGGGELLSIVGRTGSGKTTLGLIMAGLLKPTKGRVALEDLSGSNTSGVHPPRASLSGVNTSEVSPTRRLGVAMVFQFPESQFFEERVFDEVAFGPSRLGLRGEAVRQRVVTAMEKVKLDFHSLSNRSPLSLSEGERRKVAIASALSCGPRFLILDEPTVSLDWEASARVFDVLAELRNSGVSVVVMTHELEDAVTYSDRLAVLAEGRLLPFRPEKMS